MNAMQRKLHLCLAVVLLAIGLPASAQKTYDVINYDFDTTYVDGVFGAEPLSIPMYEADITSSTRSYVGLDTITGWTPAGGDGTAPVATEGLAGGILKYGTGAWIDYTTYTVPSTSPNGTSHALALAAAIGGNTVQYTSNQELTLMPGEYTMSVWVYNSSGEGKDNIGTANVTNLIGLVDADGNFVADADEADIASSYTTYTLDEWTEDVITFTIATPTTAYISLGYTSPASSSFGAPHLFIDQVTITNASFVTSDIAGNYYLRTLVDGEYKYLTEGADWATRAILADTTAYATPLVLNSYNAQEGYFTFFFPHNGDYFFNGDGSYWGTSDFWCDNSYNNVYYLAEQDGKYAIMLTSSTDYYGTFIYPDGDATSTYAGSTTGTYVNFGGEYDDAFVWELVPWDEFIEEEIDPVYDQAIVDQAEPWGLVVETADEVLSFLDKLSTTDIELTSDYSDATAFTANTYELYNDAAQTIGSYVSQTVTLDHGFYKLTAQALQRIAWNGTGDGGRAPFYLRAYSSDNEVKVLLPSLLDDGGSTYTGGSYYTYDGLNYANNTTFALYAFDTRKAYINELYFVVEGDATEVTIDFCKYIQGYNGNWMCYKNFTLERYDLDFDYEITAVVPQDEEEVGCLYVLEYTIANGENDIDAVYPNYDYEDDIVVYDSEGNVVTTGSLLSISGCTFTIQLDEVVDDYGTYTVEIPAYLFGDDDADKSGFASGHANPTTTFTYTITADKAHEGFSINPIDVAPEEGKTYGSLDGFTLSSETGTLSLNGSKVATLYDGDGNAVATGTLTANEDGSISIELDETIVASGVYTLVIPREALKVTDSTVDLNESVLVYKLQYVYVVDGSCNITFDPEEEVTTTGLSVITATFNEVDAVIVESNNEYIEGAYFYIYTDAECTTKKTKADGTDNYAYVTPNVFGDSSEDPGKTYSVLNDVENPSNVLTLTLAEDITTAGTYYIVIDTDDGKHADETTVLLYNWDASTTTNGGWTVSEMQQDYVAVFVVGIVGDITLTATDPEADATVATLTDLCFSSDDATIYANYNFDASQIVLTNNTTGNTYSASSLSTMRGGGIVISFDEAVTETGEYTLSIPEGAAGDLDAYYAGFEVGHVNAAAEFSYTVTGPYADYTITPSVGTYNALSEFTLSNSTGTIVFNWWGYNPYILDSEGTKTYIKGDDYLTQNEDGSITLTLADEIVAAGTYTLVIPSYCISVGNDGTEGEADSDYETITYDITYNYVVDGTLNVTFDPEDGSTVQGLDEITVTFNDMETVTCEGTMIGVNETYYYIYTDETLENKVFQSNGNANYAVATTSSTDDNTLVLTLAEDITEEGTYYIVITGSNTILNGGDLELTEDIVASFTIYDPYKLYLDIEVEASDPTAGDVEYVESSILFHVVSDIAVYIVNDANYDASGIIVYDADGNAVTYGTALTMEEGIANYFTVELADVITENGDYTIVLPEAIVGDEDADRTSFAYGHANYEQSFTFSVTPKYYFKVAGAYQYLQRAGNWGTELTLGSVGTLFTKVDEDSTFYLTTSDAVAAGSSNIYVTGPTSAYVDASSGAASWSLEDAGDGTYYIVNSNGNYLCGSYYEDTSYGYAYYYIGEATSTDDAPAFELISRTEYIESLSARLDDQAATAAAAAGLSATTVEELEAAVAEYEATDVAISYDDFAAIYTNGATDIYAAAAISDPTIEVYNGCGGAEQTISGLAAGLYKVTLNAMSRAFLISSYESNAALAGFSSDAAFIYANDAVDQTAFYGDYEDYLDVNSISDFISAAEEGAYEKTLYVYVADGEDLTIGFEAPYRTNYEASWTITGNWTVTLLADVDTSISSISINADGTFEPTAVYSVSGQLIRTQATSLEGLPQGIYIVNGQKMLVK